MVGNAAMTADRSWPRQLSARSISRSHSPQLPRTDIPLHRLAARRMPPPVSCSLEPLAHQTRAPSLLTSAVNVGADKSRARTDLHAVATACSELHAPAGNHSKAHKRGHSSTRATRRLRVAVDVDEVLGRFVYTLNKYCKETHDKEYDVGDYFVYEFAKIWKCSPAESNEIVHSFFKSRHFCEGIPVIPGALDALQRLGTYCDLVVVTSRQHCIQTMTEGWLEKHFPGVFSEVYFGNHFALEGKSRKKSDICRSIGADVLIDDNPQYAIDCAGAGISVLLYDWEDTYPWSKMPPSAESRGISVVRNWDEVERALAYLHETVGC